MPTSRHGVTITYVKNERLTGDVVKAEDAVNENGEATSVFHHDVFHEPVKMSATYSGEGRMKVETSSTSASGAADGGRDSGGARNV